MNFPAKTDKQLQKRVMQTPSAALILDELVAIAQSATERFERSMHSDNSVYEQVVLQPDYFHEFIKQIGADLGVSSRSFGYYHRYDLLDLKETLRNILVTDKDLLKASKEDDLVITHHNIWSAWDERGGYFHSDHLPRWFEEMGVPKKFIPLCTHLYALKERLSGKADHKEVVRGIEELCTQINPPSVAVLDYANQPGDVYSYKGKVFQFRRSKSAFSSPVLCWLRVVYNKKENRPIGYKFVSAPKEPILLE